VSYPALRVRNAPDSLDAERIALARTRWTSQDGLLLPFERQVEEHCRMLAGQQWDVWSDQLGKFVDVTTFLSDQEKLWRQRPVVNLLAYWFMLTHARLTENPPIVTFQPSTADRADAQLAETLDTIFKTLWADVHMPEHMDRLLAWVVAAGMGYTKSYPDFDKGEEQERSGPAVAQLPHPETGEPEDVELDGNVPYAVDGSPQFEIQQDETGQSVAVATADPEYEKDGAIGVCVLNPIQVRGEWNQKPWTEKKWHIHRDYFSPEEVKARYGVEVSADVSQSGTSSGPGYLERLLFNSGHYGAAQAGGTLSTAVFGTGTAPQEGYVCVDEMWEKPSAENDQQGRLLVVTKDKVLYDGARPFPKLQGASPIRRYEFVGVPGRPNGTTPMEFLVPLQRTYNKGWAQAMEHRALMTNPMILADDSAGLDEDQFVAAPGAILMGGMRDGKPMVAAFNPPKLSEDFWRLQDLIYQTFLFLGNVHGTEGQTPTDNASGELVTQLRANSDRFIGPTARSLVTEISRQAEDWVAILSVMWTRPKLISYAGDDRIAQTISIGPELWEGNVNAVPDVESMIPEGRGEKQARVFQLWQAGWFGAAGGSRDAGQGRADDALPESESRRSPRWRRRCHGESESRAAAARHSPDEIPLFDAYNPTVHLDVTQEYIASPEFKRNTPDIQHAILEYVAKLQDFAVQKAALQAGRQAQMQAAISARGHDCHSSHAPRRAGRRWLERTWWRIRFACAARSRFHARRSETPDMVSRNPQPPGNTAPQPG
jgi:hypothetical protein